MMAPNNVACWFEIPVTDLKKSKAFYEAVLQTKLTDQEMGPNMTAVFPTADQQGVGGHLYEGKPASQGAGNTIHLVAPDSKLEETVARVEPAGGKVISPPIPIPAGRFCYILDPDGNSIGLFAA